MKTSLNSKSGFTLIEVIAVLVLLGILTAVAVPKYIDLTAEARERAVDAGIAELNGREALAWGQQMLQNSGGSVDDLVILGLVAPETLGDAYTYTPDAGDPATGGTLAFEGGTPITLTRTPASTTSPGNWSE